MVKLVLCSAVVSPTCWVVTGFHGHWSLDLVYHNMAQMSLLIRGANRTSWLCNVRAYKEVSLKGRQPIYFELQKMNAAILPTMMHSS